MMELQKEIADACTGCGRCRSECAFLQKYGMPGEIAVARDPGQETFPVRSFECSLCGLCTAVCPVGIDPAAFFLEMRRLSFENGTGLFPEHHALRSYEQVGTSKRFSWYAFPGGCDTVFFPGCALSGAYAEKVILVYNVLKDKIPHLGLVLDCCTKPSHDLGDMSRFTAMFSEMKTYLKSQGIREVLTACPNCHQIFSRYGDGLSVKSIYEYLLECGYEPETADGRTEGVVHDPCVTRFNADIQKAVRGLLKNAGMPLEEMPHAGEKTICCGEGGTVGALIPLLADRWREVREEEAGGRTVVTYCAGCSRRLGKRMPTKHILDVLFPGRSTAAKPPLTYLHRLKLKRWCRTHIDFAVSRERTFVFGKPENKRGIVKFLLFLGILAGILAGVNAAGLARFLAPEVLRSFIERCGIWAPLAYMGIYALGPAFFLPGLPLTVAGGILFGPVWGVVYTIIGATAGACVAFLVSRHLARDFLVRKLTSPRWRRLDAGVEKHGWKVVVFTRLVPLFPFNLLNYAFGLTGIGFFTYAATTFICMLPACIAYIVFSSSLLDVVRGKISPAFVFGLGLVVAVSLIPVWYRRYRQKHGGKDLI